MTQVNTIRKVLLKDGSLTQRSALMDFSIMALPRRIADLKASGFPVKTEIKINPKTGQRYAQYTMAIEITHINQLKVGNVYRIINGLKTVFCEPLLVESDGYFRVTENDGLNVVVRMAGQPQVFSKTSFPRLFDIHYVGGVQ